MAAPEFRGHSFQAGAVRCHEPLGLDAMPVSDAAWQRAQTRIAEFFPQGPWNTLMDSFGNCPTQAVAIGGTLVMAAKLMREKTWGVVEKTEGGFKVGREDFRRLNDRLRRLSHAERLQLPYLVPGRADIVCAGILCLTHVLDLSGCTEVLVTDWGLRHGILRRWSDFR